MVRNVHARTLPRTAAEAGALLDSLAGPDDALWPTHAWPPIRFDRPLQVGADGGHGPIRYVVTEYEPGRRLRCEFAGGINGWHELRIEGNRMVHEIVASPRGWMRLGWPLAVRWLHDALLEDLLDNAEGVRTNRWSPYVRLLRALTKPPQRTGGDFRSAGAAASSGQSSVTNP